MSAFLHPNRSPARAARLAAGVLLAVCLSAQPVLANSALVRSLIVPGAGQAHQGHYRKAALFAGIAFASAAGLVVSAVNYNTAVDKYEADRRTYLSFQERLQDGEVISSQEIDAKFEEMQNDFDRAETRVAWRNTFFGLFLATYALNVIDVIISEPYDVDAAQRYSVDADGRRVLVTRSFRF